MYKYRYKRIDGDCTMEAEWSASEEAHVLGLFLTGRLTGAEFDVVWRLVVDGGVGMFVE